MTMLVLIACIGRQRVAFDAATIEAVVDLSAVVSVPQAPVHVLGLAAIRSQVVTVIDAARSVGVGTTSAQGRAVIVEVDGHRYALRVDAVDDVVAHRVARGVTTALMSSGWAAVTVGRVDLGHEFALLLDPAGLIAGSQQALAA